MSCKTTERLKKRMRKTGIERTKEKAKEISELDNYKNRLKKSLENRREYLGVICEHYMERRQSTDNFNDKQFSKMMYDYNIGRLFQNSRLLEMVENNEI